MYNVKSDENVDVVYLGIDLESHPHVIYFEVTNKTDTTIHFSIPRIWNDRTSVLFGVGQYDADVKPHEKRVIGLNYFYHRFNLKDRNYVNIALECINWIDDPEYDSKMYEYQIDYDPDVPEPSKKIANTLFIIDKLYIPLTKYDKNSK